MNDTFTILTDSTANLPRPYIEKYGIAVLPLTYMAGEKGYPGYSGTAEESFEQIYEDLRSGKRVTTSMVNRDAAYEAAKRILEQGKDILYIGLSSKLSGTYYAVESALGKLQGEFPDRKIYAVDSLCAALGEGLLVYGAVKQKKQEKTIAEIYEWCSSSRWRVNTVFTVDDLKHLQRSGRASSAIAIVGSVLRIKPVLRMNDGGVLRQEAKVRGRKRALDEIVRRALAGITEAQMVFVSHGDCIGDAGYVAECLSRSGKVTKVILNMLDPVIGIHTGPGSIGVFYTEAQ